MSAQVFCHNCGAPWEPHADARSRVCAYCKAVIQASIDGEQLAVGFKLDASDIDAFLDGLSKTLEPTLGDQLRVQRSGGRITLFELNLDPDVFIARREAHGVVGQYRKLVRGVALKTATQPLDRWAEMLMKSLAGHANENARVAHALAQFKGS